MQQLLIQKFHRYLVENNPDLLLSLQEQARLSAYLQESVAGVDELLNSLLATGTPAYLVEERCMDALTAPLRPSRYLYLLATVEEIFTDVYEQWRHSGLLTTEIINLIAFCDPVFEGLEFSEANQEDAYLRYAIIGSLDHYLQQQTAGV